MLSLFVLRVKKVCLLLHPLLHPGFALNYLRLAFFVAFLLLSFKVSDHSLFSLYVCVMSFLFNMSGLLLKLLFQSRF